MKLEWSLPDTSAPRPGEFDASAERDEFDASVERGELDASIEGGELDASVEGLLTVSKVGEIFVPFSESTHWPFSQV